MFILFLGLAAIVTACPPIFNDFYYLGNETHTTADLVKDFYKKKATQGWSEVVTHVCQVFHSIEIVTELILVDWSATVDLA